LFVSTFYSFKGGVGRTMAIVNVAFELVRRGRRVLLVDFDLEAPGLTTYDLLRHNRQHPGMVEYVSAYLADGRAPDVSRFCYRIDILGRADRKSRPSRRHAAADHPPTGDLWVMPAGTGTSTYSAQLASIDWTDLYRRRDGYLFFEDTKLQWQSTIAPDYVLIDSRTGHTEVEGICTRQLADAVVLLFFPNEQNRHGLKDVCQAIRREESATGRRIPMLLVMSNVPRLDDEDHILQRQERQFLQALKFPRLDLTIDRYDSLLHLEQRIFVLDRPRSRLADQYRKLATRLIALNSNDREGAILHLEQLQESINRHGFFAHDVILANPPYDDPEGQAGEVYDHSLNRQRLAAIVERFPSDTDVLMRIAQVYHQLGDYQGEVAVLDQVLRISDDQTAKLMRSRCRFQLGDRSGAVEDVVAIVKTQPNELGVMLAALSDLRRYDPALLRGVVDPDKLRSLPTSARIEVSQLVATSDDEFGMAVALLESAREEVTRGDSRDMQVRHLLAVYRLYRQEWRSVIELLTPWHGFPVRRYEAMARFHIALAVWGMSGQLREDLCSDVATLAFEPTACASHASDCLALSIVYWAVGKQEMAEQFLSRARELAARQLVPELSYWRCEEVAPEIFLEDCKSVNRLIHGIPARPIIFEPRSAR
jgi:MinD-like ATPase involved in chromosome partitioning or flagellar assembly